MDDPFLEMIHNANNPEAKLASIVTELKWYFIDIKLILGVGADSVSVVAKGLMERRAFADGSVNQVAVRRVALRENVDLDGDEQIIRGMRKLAEHGLAADDDECLGTGDASGSADDVFKLVSLHGGGIGF